MAVTFSPAARAALERMNTNPTQGPRPARSGASEGPDFGEVLKDALTQASEAEGAAEAKATAFARGEAGIHETIIAQEKAGVAVRYAVTVKNKALEAYREIMNTQV